MMKRSPWLDFEKPEWPCLKSDVTCEIAIIGGGIAGVATLYYLLKSTQKKVVLLERDRIANGATGHNAGLALSAIEKPTEELVRMFGLQETRAMFQELNAAWEDLHAIHDEIHLKDNLLSFPFVINGFNTLSRFISFVQGILLRGDKDHWRYLVLENLREKIPKDLLPIIEFVSQRTLLEALKTVDANYVAATLRVTPFNGKRMNSAKFCYKILDYLQKTFSDRFCIYEQTNIRHIQLHETYSLLEHLGGTVTAQEVILCTNAYTDFSIWDHVRQKAFTKLRESIITCIGYVAAFSDVSPEKYAIHFFHESEEPHSFSYWYFTHAPHPNHDFRYASVIGGPDYKRDMEYSLEGFQNEEEKSLKYIEEFLNKTFAKPFNAISFFWHGWMGYTKNGLRWVGPDGEHPHLWYNLACNGIGIVPAIAGAKKIANSFSGQK